MNDWCFRFPAITGPRNTLCQFIDVAMVCRSEFQVTSILCQVILSELLRCHDLYMHPINQGPRSSRIFFSVRHPKKKPQGESYNIGHGTLYAVDNHIAVFLEGIAPGFVAVVYNVQVA